MLQRQSLLVMATRGRPLARPGGDDGSRTHIDRLQGGSSPVELHPQWDGLESLVAGDGVEPPVPGA